MVSSENENFQNEIYEHGDATSPNAYGEKNQMPLYISTSQRGLLKEEVHGMSFVDRVKGFTKFKKQENSSKLPTSSSSTFWRISDESQEIPNQSSSRRFFDPFIRKINWASLWEMSKDWIRDPLNMALFVWVICVAISGAILFLVMTGMLNGALHKKSQRDAWFEVNNQIINALFTLMCLYQHPKRFHHLVLLCRWQPKDILKLQKIYCKNGTQKPNERKHMMVVVALLHVNCFAQYVLCGLNIGYPRSRRPALGVGVCLSVAMGAAAVASVYNILSPLGKEYENETVTEEVMMSPAKKYYFISRADHRTAESTPQWAGGLFDFWDDINVAYMSVFCSCCVFGWNMDRLGFGNMYVHTVTFLLFCSAPFFIFNLAAINIDNETVREALGISGFVLCMLGLLYGGFWRIQMRKRFNLPESSFCCGKPSVTDCFQWLCCCWCSLAQEVRTGDYYDVGEDKLYMKQMGGDNTENVMSPLPREDGASMFKSSHGYSYWGNSNSSYFRMEHLSSPRGEEGSSMGGKKDTMIPPVTPVIYKEVDFLL